MFDIGFSELMIVMVVALLVIGPERMPGLVRKAGLWFGKARRFVTSVKQDIDQELAQDELKRLIQEQKDSVGLHDIIEETKDVVDHAKQEYLVKTSDDIEDEVHELEASVKSESETESDDRTEKQ